MLLAFLFSTNWQPLHFFCSSHFICLRVGSQDTTLLCVICYVAHAQLTDARVTGRLLKVTRMKIVYALKNDNFTVITTAQIEIVRKTSILGRMKLKTIPLSDLRVIWRSKLCGTSWTIKIDKTYFSCLLLSRGYSRKKGQLDLQKQKVAHFVSCACFLWCRENDASWYFV